MIAEFSRFGAQSMSFVRNAKRHGVREKNLQLPKTPDLRIPMHVFGHTIRRCQVYQDECNVRQSSICCITPTG